MSLNGNSPKVPIIDNNLINIQDGQSEEDLMMSDIRFQTSEFFDNNKQEWHDENNYQEKEVKIFDNNQTLRRFQAAEQRRKNNIELLKHQKYQQELETNQQKNPINSVSQQIINTKMYVPIQQRTEQVLQQKNDHIKQLKQKIQEEQREKSVDLTIEQPSSKIYTKQDISQFNLQKQEWQQRKLAKNQQLFMDQLMRESQDNTFTPKINQKTQYVKNQVNVHDRLYQNFLKIQQKKIQQQSIKLNQSPLMNNKSKKIVQKKQQIINNSQNNQNIQKSAKNQDINHIIQACNKENINIINTLSQSYVMDKNKSLEMINEYQNRTPSPNFCNKQLNIINKSIDQSQGDNRTPSPNFCKKQLNIQNILIDQGQGENRTPSPNFCKKQFNNRNKSIDNGFQKINLIKKQNDLYYNQIKSTADQQLIYSQLEELEHFMEQEQRSQRPNKSFVESKYQKLNNY